MFFVVIQDEWLYMLRCRRVFNIGMKSSRASFNFVLYIFDDMDALNKTHILKKIFIHVEKKIFIKDFT